MKIPNTAFLTECPTQKWFLRGSCDIRRNINQTLLRRNRFSYESSPSIEKTEQQIREQLSIRIKLLFKQQIRDKILAQIKRFMLHFLN